MTTGQNLENLLINDIEEPDFPSETIAEWGQDQDGLAPPSLAVAAGESSQGHNSLLPPGHRPAPVRVLTGPPTN